MCVYLKLPFRIEMPSAEYWWCTPLTPALRRQRRVGCLVYRESSRIAKAAQRTSCLKKKRNNNNTDALQWIFILMYVVYVN